MTHAHARTTLTFQRRRFQARHDRAAEMLATLRSSADDRLRRQQAVPGDLQEAIRRLNAERSRVDRRLENL